MDMVQAVLAEWWAIVVHVLTAPSSRLGLPALLAGWVIGAFAWRHYLAKDGFSLTAYLRYAFPARVYATRSLALDVQLFLFNHLLNPVHRLARILSISLVATTLAGWLATTFGPMQSGSLSWPATLALGGLLLLALDLGTYVVHRMSHEIPVLWAFHRLHHSAPELNPLTVDRKHPVYSVLSLAIDCIAVGPLQALIIWQFGAQDNASVVAVSNAGFVVFAYAASSLRHSHIWLSFGPVLDRIFVSPALHQIHHSSSPRHFDRNYGEVLAIWDTLFGTLYLPREREELRFGIAGEAVQPHPHLPAALLEPFGWAWRALRGRTKPPILAEPAE